MCEAEMALVRCGTCGSSCVLDGLAQEEDAFKRVRSDVGVDALVSASQSPENQSVCCNVSTDFEGGDGHQKHFCSSGQEGVRQTARMLGTLLLEACASASKVRRNGRDGEPRSNFAACSKALFVLVM